MEKPKHMKFLSRIICGNTHSNIFLIRHLTTHIYNDILVICHTKKRKRSLHSIVPDAGINGFPAILKKSQQLVQVATVHTGKNPVRGSKRGLSKGKPIQAMVVGYC